jgi:hypothetical protein
MFLLFFLIIVIITVLTKTSSIIIMVLDGKSKIDKFYLRDLSLKFLCFIFFIQNNQYIL